MGAVDRLLRGTQWAPPDEAPLDLLIIDMPPGTGDASISVSQKAPLAGVLLVSTPQDVSLIDARRGAAMFRAVRVPALGLLEVGGWGWGQRDLPLAPFTLEASRPPCAARLAKG